MANLRELVSAALDSGDLSQSVIRETAIDRIGGMAFADVLGAELWRLLSNQQEAYPRVVAILGKRARPVVAAGGIRRKIAVAVVHEYVDSACRTCHGTGHLAATPTAVARLCPTCEGSLKRRYSDTWRAQQLELDIDSYRKWDRRYALVVQILADADRGACRMLALQLERVVPLAASKVLEFHKARATLRRSASPTYREQQRDTFAYSTATQ